MKLLSPLPLLIVAAAAAFVFKQGRHGVPETDSRTIAALPVDVVGVEAHADRYVLLGDRGPIVVSGETTLGGALTRLRLRPSDVLPADARSISLVEDPKDSTCALVVAWRDPARRSFRP